MSRVLPTAPDPASGTRLWHDSSPDSDVAMSRYGASLLGILERPMPLAPGAQNELAPRRLSLSADARLLWIGFADRIGVRLGVGGEFEPIRGLANKLPEHAARIAAVLTLVHDIEAGEVAAAEIEAGIAIVQHHAAEAMRLYGASCISGVLRDAQRLLAWLQTTWGKPIVSLPDIYRYGPSAIRDAACARRTTTILAEHGWLAPESPCEIDGTYRREVWRIFRG
jgi:hypothetical protein